MTHTDPNQLRIIMAQLNFCVGDVAGNAQKLIKAAQQARDELQGDLVVFPELALSGYPPEDLLFRSDFHQQIAAALALIKQKVTGIDVLLGYPCRVEDKMFNAAGLIRNQQIVATYYKQCLPNYGVFDEKRYFIRGKESCVFTLKGAQIGIIICEDIWYPEPIGQAKQQGAQMVICLNASPFDVNKPEERVQILQQRCRETQLPIMYAHGVGGQDDLVFDGGSMMLDKNGIVCVQAPFFVEQLVPVEIEVSSAIEAARIVTRLPPVKTSPEERMYKALVLAVRDYVNKNNFPGVLIGLSGGIDSALTLAIAVDALGAERVCAVALPSRYTSDLSMRLLQEIAENFAVKLMTISIDAVYQTCLNELAGEFTNLSPDKTEENMQARCRAVILMALSNKTGKLVLNTSNKSETAVGYTTLYGDMVGGFAVLKDVAKTWVYRLAHYRNALNFVIPKEIIERPPTAELAPNQKDEDTLPPYTVLDQILKLYVEHDRGVEEIVAAGFDQKTVQRVIAMVNQDEYKRRQAAIGPRVTTRAFGRERRFPITNQFKN